MPQQPSFNPGLASNRLQSFPELADTGDDSPGPGPGHRVVHVLVEARYTPLREGGVAPAPPPPPVITVTVSPNDYRVVQGFGIQLSAVVSGTSNQGVTWSVDPSYIAPGYSLPPATIDGTGLCQTSVDQPDTIYGNFTVYATSVADPTVSGWGLVEVGPGYYVCQDPCFALASDAIYHVKVSVGGDTLEVWLWCPQAPSDVLWSSLPLPSGASAQDCHITVTTTAVYLSIFEGLSSYTVDCPYQLYSRALSGGAWSAVALPEGVTGSTSKITAMFYNEGLENESGLSAILLIGVQQDGDVQNAVSWSTPLASINWSTPHIIYTQTLCAPIVFWGDTTRYTPMLVDLQQTILFSFGLMGGSSVHGWAQESVNSWPSSLDSTKPFGIFVTYEGTPTKWILWGHSPNGPSLWPLDFQGSSTGFVDPPQTYSSPSTNPMGTPYGHITSVFLQSDGQCAQAIMSEPDSQGMWGVSIAPGLWAIVTVWQNVEPGDPRDPRLIPVGDHITVSLQQQDWGSSQASPTNFDWTPSSVSSSWEIMTWDSIGGSITLQKLDDLGGDFDLVCNVTVTSPFYGGQTWVVTTDSINMGMSSGNDVAVMTDSDSWGFQSMNTGMLGLNVAYLTRDPATDLLNTKWGDNVPLSCITNPSNYTTANPGAGYGQEVLMEMDLGVLVYAPTVGG